MQEEGSPGPWRRGCRSALAHARAPHAATSKRRWRPGARMGWGQERRVARERPSEESRVEERILSTYRLALRFLVWSNLEDSRCEIRMETEPAFRLGGIHGSLHQGCLWGRGGRLLFIEGCVVWLCCLGSDYLG